MGYYTTYKLKWQPHGKVSEVPNCNHNVGKHKYCPECGTPSGFIALDERVGKYLESRKEEMYGIHPNGESTEAVKWYEHEEHMKTMSVQFKNVLFTLSGEGEDSGDIWNKYYLNGKSQISKSEIRCEPFDESKLK